MEEFIKYVKNKIPVVYILICFYLNRLPLLKKVRYFFPLTCTNCNSFDNEYKMLILKYYPTLNSKVNDYVLGFCSDYCFSDYYLNVYIIDRNTCGNYIKLIKHNLTNDYHTIGSFDKKMYKLMISNPILKLRKFYKLSCDMNDFILNFYHDNLYYEWIKINDINYYHYMLYDIDFFPFIKLKSMKNIYYSNHRIKNILN